MSFNKSSRNVISAQDVENNYTCSICTNILDNPYKPNVCTHV